MMQLQYANLSRQKPANLPPLPDIILNEVKSVQYMYSCLLITFQVGLTVHEPCICFCKIIFVIIKLNFLAWCIGGELLIILTNLKSRINNYDC